MRVLATAAGRGLPALPTAPIISTKWYQFQAGMDGNSDAKYPGQPAFIGG
jgi:hypothetical protein